MRSSYALAALGFYLAMVGFGVWIIWDLFRNGDR